MTHGTGSTVQAEAKIEVHKWLIQAGLESAGEQELVAGFARQLSGLGFDLRRFSVGSDVLHPVHEGRGIVWYPDQSAEVNFYEPMDDDELQSDEWLRSPFYHLIKGNDPTLLRQLQHDYIDGEFPMLDRFKSEGMTGYLAVRVGFGEGGSLGDHRGVVASFCIDTIGGFSDDAQAAIHELTQTFALSFKAMMEVFTGRTLMQTYLGRNAAKRVLKGAIRRGSAEPFESVLWYSDLKGFTRIADSAPRAQLMPLLNDYAECVATAIERKGGEILKFMGDGILAMFPAENAACACDAALHAAKDAISAAEKVSAVRLSQGLPVSDFYLGLHRGDVLFGNIGSRERLDFTVIGPTVNELARIESMCRTLDQRVMISSDFARTPGFAVEKLVSLGRYALRGVSRPQELFTIDPQMEE